MSPTLPLDIEAQVLASLAKRPATCAALAQELGVRGIDLGPRLNSMRSRRLIVMAEMGDCGKGVFPTWTVPGDKPAPPPPLKGAFQGATYGPPAIRGPHPADTFEARFVRDRREQGVPWTAVANMVGKNVAEVRRRYDPQFVGETA